MTGTLHTSTVSDFKTSAVHKYLNNTKYSYTTIYSRVLTKYVITSVHHAMSISSTVYHNERLTYTMVLWMLITTGQEMSP